MKIALLITSFILLFIVSIAYLGGAGNNYQTISPEPDKVIFIGVDGVAKDTFDYVRDELGLFKIFENISSHIAPFPSMSDYAWNVMVHAREVNGKRGKILTYEAAHYNYRKNYLVDDARNYFRRLGQKNLYLAGAFEHYLNPYAEALLYLPTKELPKLELSQFKKAIIDSGNQKLVSVMVASADAIAHTRADYIDFLVQLDDMLNQVHQYYKDAGINAEIIVVSDHGQGAGFIPGEEPFALKRADIDIPVKRAKLNRTKKLINDNDIVIPIMALANYAAAGFKNLSHRNEFIKELQKEEWFQNAYYISPDYKGGEELEVVIKSKTGKAVLSIHNVDGEFNYIYRPKDLSNPLDIPKELHNRELKDTEIRDKLFQTQFPDAFFRLADMAFQRESEMPDLIFTLKDDFCVRGSFDKFTTMYRTHGSMARRASCGIAVTTNKDRKLPEFMRTSEVLSCFGIDPMELFRVKNLGFHSDPDYTLKLLKDPDYKGIETGSNDFSNGRIFGLINKAVYYSTYVLDTPTIESLVHLLFPTVKKGDGKIDPSILKSPGIDFDRIDFTNMIGPEEIAVLTDLFIKHGDFDKIVEDEKFIKLKKRIKQSFNLQKEHGADFHVHGHGPGINSVNNILDKSGLYTIAAKRCVMKAYGTTFLLEKALENPEFPIMEDLRSVDIRKNWEAQRQQVISSYNLPESYKHMVKKVFREIFKERVIAEDITPQELSLLYNRTKNDPDNITIVYIPGIYNALFDNEIFQMGLDALVNKLGVRVISPPVISACSSSYNAEIIINYLKQDKKYLKTRGRQQQKYFIFGYSKGGVDALHAFLSDPEFVKKEVMGLLTIAAPLQGSTILNTTDLPITLLQLLGDEVICDVCKKEQRASNSITKAAMHKFMNENSEKLVGLTRYYSLTFHEHIKKAHLFMKATKNIAQFKEPNDGVVTMASSKFPGEFMAVDLGEVEADHLAGIVASKFPQQAFMEAVYLTLLELDAFNIENNKKINEQILYNSSLKDKDYHLKRVEELLGAKELRFEKGLNQVKNCIDPKERRQYLKVLANRIKSALDKTPYRVREFKLISNNSGIVFIKFKDSTNGFSLFSWIKPSEKVNIDDMEDLIRVLAGKLQMSGKNLLENQMEVWRTYPVSRREKFVLPHNDIGYTDDFRINIRNLEDFLGDKRVEPITKKSHPDGINIIYDHRRVVDFRNEYQFSYETSSPAGCDENSQSGWSAFLTNDNTLMAKLTSNNSSIKLTSYALRFKPVDFPKIEINLQVNDDVDGADVMLGGSGKDDSAFQLWLMIRELPDGADRALFSKAHRIRLLGYYFGDEIKGKHLVDGEIYENYYSKRKYYISVFPEIWQVLIGHGKDQLKKPINFQSRLSNDLAKVFPDTPLKDLEVVGITIQHDSNDTENDSTALFKAIKFLPEHCNITP